eukprot:m.145494 g.145494  ORF g.145494 m.145494 type:complete len:55 (+) comp38424_c0_seq11:27-191(+)
MLKERISKWMLCSHRLRIRLDWLAGCLQRIEKKQEVTKKKATSTFDEQFHDTTT